ncbi:TPA: histidinol-phosphatase [Candidatus Delongbacteria bacterium]|nr:histidinol-phosphatase [Candidatus Delongbacteria bacterium]
MLKEIKSDLHIHTCLSPCGDDQMIPEMIVEKAATAGLDAIGICDHNSSENTEAVMEAGKKYGIKVFPGMEVTSKEEVHILAIFDTTEDLYKLQKIVYENLEGENNEDLFGYQIVTDRYGKIIELNTKMLIGATNLSVEKIIELIHSFGGLAIASHVDRERFSLIGQLGFVPLDIELDGMELSPVYMAVNKKLDYPMSSGLPMVTFSDAHFIDDIGKTLTIFLIEEITVSEIKKALENKDGRSVLAYT